MYRSTIAASAMLVLTGCQKPVAPAAESARDQVTPTAHSGEYDVSRCSCPTAIPDENLDGVLIGPLSIPDDGGVIQDVVLEVGFSHSYGGDLSAWLYYDADHDGTHDAETPVELYLARSTRDSSPMWGHVVALDGVYFFQHEKEAAALDGWDAGTFTSFRGLDRGGSFYLRVVDRGDGGVGAVQSWAVYVK